MILAPGILRPAPHRPRGRAHAARAQAGRARGTRAVRRRRLHGDGAHRARTQSRASGVQLILVCGKNEEVAAELRAMKPRIPMLVEGFTREIPLYMELSDFFIGKPGPGSLSEALVKKLPVIVQRNAWTMVHELYNTEWIEELGAGLVVENFSRDIAAAVRTLLAPENYARHRNARLRRATWRSTKSLRCWRRFCRAATRIAAGSGIRFRRAISPR